MLDTLVSRVCDSHVEKQKKRTRCWNAMEIGATLRQERKSNPMNKFWDRVSGGRPRGYPGRPGAKTSVKPSKSRRNKHFGADVHDPKARTSMTPGACKKNFGRKNVGLNFRSLLLFEKLCLTKIPM